MNNERVTIPEDRNLAPYAALTPEMLASYKGKIIAVERTTGVVLGVAKTVADLRKLMVQQHPECEYRTLPVADLSSL